MCRPITEMIMIYRGALFCHAQQDTLGPMWHAQKDTWNLIWRSCIGYSLSQSASSARAPPPPKYLKQLALIRNKYLKRLAPTPEYLKQLALTPEYLEQLALMGRGPS
jgi:hypothetical protein